MRSSISVHITLVVIGLLLCARTGECESKRRPKRSSSSDREKLSSHGRKSFFVDPSTSLQCQASDMVVENSVMIDSKSSLASGAKFLQVEKVNFDGKSTSLVQLQESCSKICCDYEENVCDTALLSLVIGEEGYRCYLFRCDEKCVFIKHSNYVVLHKKSPEQFVGKNDNVISTGQNQNKNLCNLNYEFKCRSGEPKCIPIYDVCDSISHCSDKSDEVNCTSVSSSSSVLTSTRKAGSSDSTSKIKPNDDADTDDSQQTQYDTGSQAANNNANSNDGDDYTDDYEMKLLKQQSSIIKHLKELEDVWERENKQNTKKKEEAPALFKTPEGFLDSFLKSGLATSSTKRTSTSKSKTSTTTTKKAKVYFHDHFNSQDSMFGSDQTQTDFQESSRLLFEDEDTKKWSMKSGTTTAILLLALGCALVIAFFVYLLLSTRFVSKKIKWAAANLPGAQKNVDVDGDYLINGMYL